MSRKQSSIFISIGNGVASFKRQFNANETFIGYLFMSIARDEDLRPSVNPCAPSPCGPYSECRDINGQASCACLSTYMGTPPNCRPECLINSECLSNRACIQKKCRNPCDGVCGVGAVCNVINHTPTCSCPNGFTGDSFVQCRLIPEQGKMNKYSG